MKLKRSLFFAVLGALLGVGVALILRRTGGG